MYGKLFEQMYDSTLADDWRALVTFQQMIILCDSDGVLDKTPGAISRVTGIPMDIIGPGIEILEQPDPASRSPAEEGRRIVRIDDHRAWGWRIVNHAYYRALASREDKKKADRERMAEKRKSGKTTEESDTSQGVATCSKESLGVAEKHENQPNVAGVAHTDADTDTEEITTPNGVVASACGDPPPLDLTSPSGSAGPPPCPMEDIAQAFREILPGHPKPAKPMTKSTAGYLRARWREDPTRQSLDYWRRLFAFVRDYNPFLTGQAEATNGRDPFVMSLRWLVRPENFEKVTTGEYDKRKAERARALAAAQL